VKDDAPKPYETKIDRRTALTWVGIVGAATAAGAGVVLYGPKFGGKPVAKVPGTFTVTKDGYGTDPKLNPPDKAPWPRIMTDTQLQVAAVVVDHILPATATAPSASSLGVPDFLNEWVSAPYPDQLKDRPIILMGLDELGADFLKTDAPGRTAKLAALPGSEFFRRMRALTIGAYYTTEEGFKDIGYIGNEARASDPGPSAEAKAHVERELRKLGL
jgi:hypothetical protein